MLNSRWKLAAAGAGACAIIAWVARGALQVEVPAKAQVRLPQPERSSAAPPAFVGTAEERDGQGAPATAQQILRARLPNAPNDADRWRAWIAPASISAEDLADREDALAQGRPAPEREEYWNFRGHRPVGVGRDGQIGPISVPPAEAYEIVAFKPGWIAQIRVKATRSTEGAAFAEIDGGELQARPTTRLAVRLVEADGLPRGFSLALSRPSPTLQGAHQGHLFHLLMPDIGGLLSGEARAALTEQAPLLLEPLPDEAALRLTPFSPLGVAGGPIDFAMRPGELNEVEIRPRSHMPEWAWTEATLRGRIVWTSSRDSIRGGTIRDERRGRSAAVSLDGEFSLLGLPAQGEAELVVSGFDPSWPQRLWRFVVHWDPSSLGAPQILEIPHLARISARGLGSPIGMDGRAPLAYALQRQADDGRFVTVAGEEFTPSPGGVEVSAAPEPGIYRILAAWSPVVVELTEPFEVTSVDQEISVTFTPAIPNAFVSGVVVNERGAPQPGARIEAVGPVGGIPPITLFAGPQGEFVVEPLNTDTTLLASSPEGTCEMTVAPASSTLRLVVKP
ncbi:MAG: carboxypeptidase regulatory-like domain-containing protein [Planctomycetes bacterium]|nr:carboxypeptidase regulatory-like domain-containing protein [Planctomycetota bacterium]